MEPNLKQRLVGALVLISLAVIFLPLAFDRQQQRIDTSPYTIPEKPAITIVAPNMEPLEQTAREQYGVIAKVSEEKRQQEEASSSADHNAVSRSPPPVSGEPVSMDQTRRYLEQEKAVDTALQNQPVTTTVPLAEAWVIQVGAFSSEANAKGLQDKLKSAGYAAFVKGGPSAGGTLYKVYVGPEIRRAQLEQQKSELERKYNLKALILKYIP